MAVYCFPFLFTAALLSSCTYAVSKKYVEQAPKNVTFSDVRQNPELYVHNIFVFGGTIVETKNTKEGSELEIVQNPVNKYGYIETADESDGRLILTTARQLDPMIFKRGRLITFAGELTGTWEGKIGEREYTYPVFEVRQIHLWGGEKNYYYPPYYYGFGPFAYPPYYPYYYPGPPFGYPYWWY